MIPIYIVNFNTNKLTNNCIKSIINNIKSFDYQINIFDNSDTNIFNLDKNILLHINIIDNTKQQLINFENLIDQYNIRCFNNMGNHHGSFKHCRTIQYIIDNCQDDEMLLFDSDTILLKDIDFIDNQYITIGGADPNILYYLNNKNIVEFPRIFPFLQYFNIKMIKNNQIKYFDNNRIMLGNTGKLWWGWDTGASFTCDIINKKLPYKIIQEKQYINHLHAGSWK